MPSAPERRAASPAACARIFSIPHWRLRAAIRNGELTAFAVGRKSLLVFTDVENWIRAHPPTKSSRSRLNQARAAAHMMEG